MAIYAYQALAITGTAPSYGAVAATDSVAPNPHGFIHVKNGGGVSTTVTVIVPGTQYGQARPDVAIVIAAGADRFIPMTFTDLADPADGLIDITYSPTASVTAAALTF